MNRYSDLERHADAGLGAEEFDQIRRFTRPTEKTPVRTAKHITEAFNTNSQKEN